MTERIRTTISLTPEAYDIFKRMAEAGNTSVSRCMGDWLSDTADAAELITLKMEEAKSAPMAVLREMQALLVGMGEAVIETKKDLRDLQTHVRQANRSELASEDRMVRVGLQAPGAPVPPSSNTGGKSPKPLAPKPSKGGRK